MTLSITNYQIEQLIEEYDFPIYKVHPWQSTLATILWSVGYVSSLMFIWWPIWILFLIPSIGIAMILNGLRTRALTAFKRVFIPAERYEVVNRLRQTLIHESTHVRQQIRLGFFRFLLKWGTPRGCIELEAEAFVGDMKCHMELNNQREPWPGLFDHYSKVIKNSYLQVRLFGEQSHAYNTLKAWF